MIPKYEDPDTLVHLTLDEEEKIPYTIYSINQLKCNSPTTTTAKTYKPSICFDGSWDEQLIGYDFHFIEWVCHCLLSFIYLFIYLFIFIIFFLKIRKLYFRDIFTVF